MTGAAYLLRAGLDRMPLPLYIDVFSRATEYGEMKVEYVGRNEFI